MSEIEWDKERLENEIRGTITRVTAGAIHGVELAALMVQADVQRAAPVDTGQYRASIRTTEPDVTEDNVTVRLGTKMPQACRLEYGFADTDSLGRTYNQAPRPHWRPAFDNNRKRAHDIIAEEMRKEE